MLTKRQNLLETIHGGHPDRFVNQYEFIGMVIGNPYTASSPRAPYGGEDTVNSWGVTSRWPVGTPGPFPVHTPEKTVIKDITHWKDDVKAPNVKFSDSQWEPFLAAAEKIDRNEQFLCPFVAPGIFEQTHHLQGIENCLINFYDEPQSVKELISYLTEWELQYAEELCSHLHPDGLFHHDDWGSQQSTFLSPAMFEEFLLPAYKQIYGYYKSHGVELIIHHSDSYAATLVPYMIEMGIDIWQGVMTSNNIPELLHKYGGQISFMGGIDSASIDYEGWTPEIIEKQVRKACLENGKYYFIPSASQGLAISTFPGVYEETSNAIKKISTEFF